jgi:ubiquitin related modifier 1
MSSSSIPSISLKIEFGGGLELLFSNKRSHKIDIPSVSYQDGNDRDQKPTNVTYLVHWLKDHLLKERPELFIENGTV